MTIFAVACFRMIRAVVHALILANEKGIILEEVTALRGNSRDAEMRNLLGDSGDIGQQLGLPADWAYQVIHSFGNYSEIYRRHYGPDTGINLEPGLNQPWSRGRAGVCIIRSGPAGERFAAATAISPAAAG